MIENFINSSMLAVWDMFPKATVVFFDGVSVDCVDNGGTEIKQAEDGGLEFDDTYALLCKTRDLPADLEQYLGKTALIDGKNWRLTGYTFGRQATTLEFQDANQS